MGVRQLIQPSITASAVAHIVLLGAIILYNEVHPFSSVTAEPIKVDLVTPDEVPNLPDVDKKPDEDKPQLQLPKDDVTPSPEQAASKPQSAPPPGAAAKEQPQQQQAQQPPQSQQQQQAQQQPPQQQTQQRPNRPDQREAAAQPQSQMQPQPQQPAPAMPPPSMPLAPQQQPQQPAYTPAEPDVTVKYNVMLGLPQALPPLASAEGDRPGDGIDANSSSAANVASSLIAKFREHLKTCSKLPASVARSDTVFVKLRVAMTPQARLAAEPILIEGSASVKALDLKNSAVSALSACQPYEMLPADRYGEWKVLDLTFTPQDFG